MCCVCQLIERYEICCVLAGSLNVEARKHELQLQDRRGYSSQLEWRVLTASILCPLSAHTATCLCVFTVIWSEHCDEIWTSTSRACVRPYRGT